MTITIGRTSITQDIQNLRRRGDSLTIGGYSDALGTVAGQVFTYQILGLAPGDVVPITWTEDPSIDGYYIVNATAVVPQKGITYNGVGRWLWEVQVSRLGYGARYVGHEVTATASARQTTYDPATQTVIIWQTANADPIGEIGWSSVVADRGLTADTTQQVQAVALVTDLDNGSTTGQKTFLIAPDDYYNAAATISHYDGTTFRPTVGYQLPPKADDLAYRLDSGVFRFDWDWSDGSITIAVLDETDGWETIPTTFELTNSATGDTAPFDDSTMTPVGARVVRNDVDCVSVRFTVTSNTADRHHNYVTVTLNRGAFHADIRLQDVTSGFDLVRIGPTSSVTVTNPNAWSAVQSSNDANGNRWALATSFVGATLSTSRGDINLDMGGTPIPFCLAVESDGSSASTYNTAAAVIGQWWTATGTTQQPVIL